MKYRFTGKEKLLSLGVYPDVGLKDAREKRDAARKLIAAGIDPSANRKIQNAARVERAENSFEVVAREWYAKHSPKWAVSHASKILTRLEKDVFPWIGGLPIAEIAAPELLATLRRIESRGAIETAHPAHQTCGQIFRYAVATGRATRDPCEDLRGALQPVISTHHASIADPKEIGALLRAMDAYSGEFATKCAARLAPLVFLRPGELRGADWAEIDLEKFEWRIQKARTKARVPHVIPFSTQAVSILAELKPLTGDGRLVFPGVRSRERPLSENTVNAALRRMG